MKKFDNFIVKKKFDIRSKNLQRIKKINTGRMNILNFTSLKTL